MRSFLMASFSRRLAICGATSFLLVLAWYGLLVLASVDGWHAAQKDHEKWVSGQKQRCVSLFDKAEAEYEAIEKGRCRLDRDFSEYSKCLDADKARKTELLDIVRGSDCPAMGRFEPGAFPILTGVGEPASLMEYALESRGMHPPIIPAGMLALTVLLFLVSDIARRLVLEPHVGWRRLSLVVSVAVPLAVFGLWLHDGEYMEDSIMAGLVGLACTSLAAVYGRAVFLWVAEGFGKSSGPPLTAATGRRPAVESTHSPAELVPSPTEAIRAPATEQPMSEPVSVSWSPATFWPRFWARCFDLPLCWMLGSVPGAFIPDIRSNVGGTFGVMLDLLAGMAVICVVAFLYEAFFVSRFGATPGKMLFGLQVRSVDDRPPTWDEAKRRGWTYLQSGLYFTFFLPVLQILGAFMAWKRREGSQPWDMAARTHVRQKPIGTFRFACAVLVSFFMVSAMVVSHKMLKEATKQEMRARRFGD